jgi:oligopeptide/dipeptide ABC transporter ATP-binding protein
MSPVLSITDLHVTAGDAAVVDGVSLEVASGECLGLVGESGSGKSLTLRAAIGLLPRGVTRAGGELRFAAADGGPPQPYRPEQARGHGISMVFQEPMTALNPTRRAGDIVADVVLVGAHGARRREARLRAVELLEEVGIPEPARRARAYPHELSGGLRQRVAIAAALAGDPRVLLCDEPTTALDVTVQDQVLQLLDRLRRERGLALVFVTHDLGVVARLAQRVAVMYAGRLVEGGTTAQVLQDPQHPYTAALRAAVPDAFGTGALPHGIPGSQPVPAERGPGCRFAPRCPQVGPECELAVPPLVAVGDGRTVACVRVEAREPRPAGSIAR